MGRSWRMLALAMVVATASLAMLKPEAAALEPRAQRGFDLARANCARCHAIGHAGESPLKEAPPFRTLHRRYPVEDLAESLTEGITTGHPTMPEFRLDPGQASDLIAYLKSATRDAEKCPSGSSP